MRAWVRTDRLTGLNLTTADIIDAIQSQNVQAAVGRIGARPISDDQQLAAQYPDQGPPRQRSRNSRISSSAPIPTARCCGLRDVARVELGAANLDRDDAAQRRPGAAIAIYQSPGANAITTLEGGARRVSPKLEKRFPDDLAWKITYDPTVFVTDTIHEVQKTLIEAFILVVIVVFLFLGSVRATLIPTFAVPVSLIGTFVALLAVGYSANTVSLLAHRAGDRHRGRRRHRGGRERRTGDGGASGAYARGGDQAGDGRNHRADHRHHAGAAVGVRAGGVHSGHFRRIVPAVRGDGRGVDVPVGDQCADVVAGAVRRAAAAASRAAPRRHGLCHALDRSRPRRLWLSGRAASCGCRSSASSWWRSPWPAIVGLVQIHADRISARGRSGRAVRRRAIAGRLVGRAHHRRHRASRGDPARTKHASKTSPRSSA